MISPKLVAAMAIASALLLWPSIAMAEPPPRVVHIESPFKVETKAGSTLNLNPGYYLDDPTYDRMEAEHKRLQEAEVRLLAENKALKVSIVSPKWFPWVSGALGILVGIGIGVAVL